MLAGDSRYEGAGSSLQHSSAPDAVAPNLRVRHHDLDEWARVAPHSEGRACDADNRPLLPGDGKGLSFDSDASSQISSGTSVRSLGRLRLFPA